MNKFGQRLRLGQTQDFQREEAFNNDQLLQRQQSLEDSMSLNVKEHIDKLDVALSGLKDELKQSRKDLNFLREELERLKLESMKSDHGVTQYVCDEINRLQTDLRKGARDDQNMTDSFTNQIVTLRMEKEDLDQNSKLLELRTDNNEQVVGFRRIYD